MNPTRYLSNQIALRVVARLDRRRAASTNSTRHRLPSPFALSACWSGCAATALSIERFSRSNRQHMSVTC